MKEGKRQQEDYRIGPLDPNGNVKMDLDREHLHQILDIAGEYIKAYKESNLDEITRLGEMLSFIGEATGWGVIYQGKQIPWPMARNDFSEHQTVTYINNNQDQYLIEDDRVDNDYNEMLEKFRVQNLIF